MKALTVCQPYAHLISLGGLAKPMENRTWATNYRGPLMIHAGKSRAWLEPGDEKRYPGLVFGAVTAVTDLEACLEIERYGWPESYQHFACHEHAHGPVCWMVPKVRKLKTPVPWKGAQGLWTPPAELVRLVEAQL